MATEFFIFRNNADRDKIIQYIQSKRLPFKVCVQDIEPTRSVEANDYYWVVLGIISEFTGHTTRFLHRHYKKEYNIKTTTTLGRTEFFWYVEQICAEWAEQKFYIPTPDETVITEELKLLK